MTDKQIFNSEEGEVEMKTNNGNLNNGELQMGNYLPAAAGFSKVIFDGDESQLVAQEFPIIGWKLLEGGAVEAITIYGEKDQMVYDAIMTPSGQIYSLRNDNRFESLQDCYTHLKEMWNREAQSKVGSL